MAEGRQPVFDLRGKTALITGADGVLGRAVAERAESLGASLLLASRQNKL